MRAVVVVLSVVVVAPARAQSPTRRPKQNHPPVITTSLPSDATFTTSDAVRFTVTVSDPDGDAVSARTIRAPGRMFLQPIVNEPSPVTREIVWYPGETDGGWRELIVEAWDARSPELKVQSRFAMSVLGAEFSNDVELIDLDGDGDLELLAVAEKGDVGNADDAGAFALFGDPFPPFGTWRQPKLLVAQPATRQSFLGRGYGQNLETADVTGDGIPDVIGFDLENGGTIRVWFGPNANGGFTAPDAILRSNDPDDGFGQGGPNVLIADVTNDGILDVIAAAPNADTATSNVGEVCVFAGGPGLVGTPAPTATLRVSNARAGDGLGFVDNDAQALFVGDVTGDGVPDLVVGAAYADRGSANPDVGKLYVWKGGSALTGTPPKLATLDATSATANSRLGQFAGTEAIHLVDVTGDGVRDIVVGSPTIGTGGTIFVWTGGSSLSGVLDANAKLKAKGAKVSDHLGDIAPGQGIQFADLNGDGVLDVVAGAASALVGTSSAAGALYYWAGGALSGTVYATATFHRTSPKKNDQLGRAVDGLQIADVTGDGRPDLVAISPDVDASAADSGSVDVWAGAANLSGTLLPSASLEVPGAAASDQLGLVDTALTPRGSGLLLADVTGDGIRDVIAAAPFADRGGVADLGAIYVWVGGPVLTGGGTLAPTATLADAPTTAIRLLGFQQGAAPAVELVDFNRDGVLDLAACSLVTSVGAGKVLLWFGGPGLTGAPAASVTAIGTQTWENFGNYGAGVRFADVTGDGHLDLIVQAPDHSAFGLLTSTGGVYVFAGGPGVSGTLSPLALLEDPSRQSYERFGMDVRIADVDHDGVDDLVVPSPNFDFGVSQGVGALFFFRGPITATPSSPSILTAGRILGTYSALSQ